MSTRVLATETARTAAANLRGTVRDLQVEAQRVMTLGDRLADPSYWDGPAAAEFRQVHWRPARASLQPAIQTLEKLRATAETVIDDILKAGGEGAGGHEGGSEHGGILSGLIRTLTSPIEDAHRVIDAAAVATEKAGLQLIRDTRAVVTVTEVAGGGLVGRVATAVVSIGHRTARVAEKTWEEAPMVARKVEGVAGEVSGAVTDEGGVVLTRAEGSLTETLNLAKGAKLVGKVAGPLAIPIAAWSEYEDDAHDTHLSTQQRIDRVVAAGLLEGGLSWFGSAVGEWVGGAIGTAVEPGGGTVVGAVAGSVGGGIVGGLAGHEGKEFLFAKNPDNLFGD